MTGFFERVSRRAAGQTGAANGVTLALRQRARFEPPVSSAGTDGTSAEDSLSEETVFTEATAPDDRQSFESAPGRPPPASPGPQDREEAGRSAGPPLPPHQDDQSGKESSPEQPTPAVTRVYEEYPDTSHRAAERPDRQASSPAPATPERPLLRRRAASHDGPGTATGQARFEPSQGTDRGNEDRSAHLRPETPLPNPPASRQMAPAEQRWQTASEAHTPESGDREAVAPPPPNVTEASPADAAPVAEPARTGHQAQPDTLLSDSRESRPSPQPPSLSIGQVSIEFQAPPAPKPQQPSGPRPVSNRTRGFESYARARRGIPR